MKIVKQIGEVAFSKPEGRPLSRRSSKDVLWACTTCRACQEICPAAHRACQQDHRDAPEPGADGGRLPRRRGHGRPSSNTEVNGNPFGMAYASPRRLGGRTAGHASGRATPRSTSSTLSAATPPSTSATIEVARSFVKLCAGGRGEGRHPRQGGEMLRRADAQAGQRVPLPDCWPAENIELIKGYGVKKIVTTCPHCFNTLAKDYRDLGLRRCGGALHHLPRPGCCENGTLKLDRPKPSTAPTTTPATSGRYKDIYRAAARRSCGQPAARLTEMDRIGPRASAAAPAAAGSWPRRRSAAGSTRQRVQMAAATGAPLAGLQLPLLSDHVRGRHQGGRSGRDAQAAGHRRDPGRAARLGGGRIAARSAAD